MGAACCLLLARALLAAGAAAFAAPISLRCLFGGSSDQSKHTMVLQSWVTATLELKEGVLRPQSADVEFACSGQFIPSELLGRKSIQICLHLSQEI